MTDNEFTPIAKMIEQHVREESFSLGLPIVYEKDGGLVLEYSDGNIIPYMNGRILHIDHIISEKQLLAAGFREYQKSKHELCDKIWWSTVVDEIGPRFQICIRLYDFTKNYGYISRRFEAESHFEDATGQDFTVKRACTEFSTEEVIAWLNTLFDSFKCRHLPKQG